MEKARVFNCNKNRLTRLPDEIEANTQWLILTENSLGDLDNLKGYLSEVSHLNMSSSKITSISSDVMTSIINHKTYLNIRNNSLRYLPQVIRNTRNTTELWIAENPYECNCNMMWMRDWLVRVPNVMDKENVTCAHGAEDIRGMALFSFCTLVILTFHFTG